MPEARSLKDFMQIRAFNKEKLESINSNLGTAIGYKIDDNGTVTNIPAIIVFVPQKIHSKWLKNSQIIPEKFYGPNNQWCEVDVVQGDRLDMGKEIEKYYPDPKMDPIVERLRGWDELIWCGSQISRTDPEYKESFGSIGCFVQDKTTKKKGLLTNEHIAKDIGTKLYHPNLNGNYIATTKRAISIIEDQNWYDQIIDEPNVIVGVDCAFAEFNDTFNQSDIMQELMGIGKLGEIKDVNFDDFSILGQKVQKIGKTSGITKGEIIAFSYEVTDEEHESEYADFLIIEENGLAFSQPGDSGSIVVTNDNERNPLGLLWGGEKGRIREYHQLEYWTGANSLSKVLDLLQVELLPNM